MDITTTPGVAVVSASVTTAALGGVLTGTTSGAGLRERRTAPTHRCAFGAIAPSGPAAPADRLLGNLRLSG